MKGQSASKKTTFAMMLAAAGALALFIIGAAAQTRQPAARANNLKPDTGAVMDTLKAMQKELQEIKALLAARPPAPPAPAGALQSATLDLTNRPFRGDKNAPVTIVEITDYQCPFCSRHALQTLPQIEKEYIATGKVKYYVLDLPLETIHRDAFKAAVAVRCAGEQGKYWEMHDRLFANQQTLNQWDAHATAINLDAAKFGACLSSDKYAADVRRDIAQTHAAGVSGTPGFYFGTAAPNGSKVKTSKFVNGARPFPALKAEIDALLNPPAAGR
jgi:protein-disulfide isomerase